MTGKIEKSNTTITLNVLYVKKMNIYPVFISKHNSNHEQTILLMIPNGEGWRYLVLKKLSALLII